MSSSFTHLAELLIGALHFSLIHLVALQRVLVSISDCLDVERTRVVGTRVPQFLRRLDSSCWLRTAIGAVVFIGEIQVSWVEAKITSLQLIIIKEI